MPRTIRVALYCADEVALSVNRFIVENSTQHSTASPMRVYPLQSEAEYRALISQRGEMFIDRYLIFQIHPQDGAREVLGDVERREHPSVFVDAVYPARASVAGWMAELRTLTRKRGPKPGTTGRLNEARQMSVVSHPA